MNVVSFHDIHLTFDGSHKYALSAINYEIKPGDFIILLGGNGSGKSSLLGLLYRKYFANSGEILFLDKPIQSYTNKYLSHSIATLTQNCADSFFNSLTLYENYLIAKEAKDFKLASNKIERQNLQAHLAQLNPNLIKKLDCTIDQFSGGERQALALAFCMLQAPSLLLLDEHTSALDPKSSKQIMELTNTMVKDNHITCILTTHDLDIALAYGNRVLILREGEIFQAIDYAAKDKLSKESLMKMYY